MKKFSILVLALLSSALLFSQEALKSIEEDYYDFLSLSGSSESPTLGYRTLSDSEWVINSESENIDNHVWSNLNLGSKLNLFQPANVKDNWYFNGIDQGLSLKIYGPEWFNSVNTLVPYGYNDGGLWQGKGYNTNISTGVRLEGYGFELTLKPNISFSQNLDFEYLKNGDKNYSEYAYFTKPGGIDLVQRYGDSYFWNFDWGDSEVRYTLYNFTMGFGTQSPWLGPAMLNPMLGSNNADTYPKFDIGLRKTSVYIPFTDIYIGDIEGRVYLGRLEESKYYDKNPDNDYRMLSGLSASYSPSFIPGLTIGLNRIYITDWATKNLIYLVRLFTTTGGNKDEDQKASVFAQWKFPKVGFEVYGEYGFDDFTSDEFSNPLHTGIYTLGFKQLIPLPGKDVKSQLLIELNNFEMSQDFQLQWQYGGYYYHGGIEQGFTNNGQIVGAGTGSMGNSQFFGYKVYYPKGDSMIYLHRYCPNNNYVYNMAVDKDASHDAGNNINKDYYASYETYFIYGLSTDFFPIGNLSVSGDFALVHIHNALYKKHQKERVGVHIELSAKYRF